MPIRLVCLMVAMVCCLTASNLRAATPEQIDKAIKSGVAYLYSKQNEFGNWEAVQQAPVDGKAQWGGSTALITYALLASGEKPLDPRIVKATEWLRNAPIIGHYALGLRANVWLNLPQTEANKAAMIKDSRLLISGIGKAGRGKGFFNYVPPTGYQDLSCSQYGVLGCWAGAQRTTGFSKEFWTTIENAWRLNESPDGGWKYGGIDSVEGTNTTIQMTAAAVATLFITQEFVHSDEGIEGNKGNPVDPYINKGLAYITKAYPALLEKPFNYAMYGIERVGVASGYKYFGNIDWFQTGSDMLVKKQYNGAWGDPHNTSFALLFLSRGRAPVMMNKLQYNLTPPAGEAKEGNWNQRPRDVANATRFVAEQAERTLNWQIINFNVGGIEDLHDSALLYISGNQKLMFTDAEKATLKQYIEEGGIIIGNADVGKTEFITSFRDLAREFFPTYEFKKLIDMPDHPLNNEQFKAATWKKKPLVEAVGNDARVFMLLIPSDDFSRTMQKKDFANNQVFEFLANAFLYSIDKTQARYKGETHIIRPKKDVATTSTVQVARLKYNGVWDPEPGGWRRLAAVMNNDDQTKLEVKTVELGKDSLEGFKVAHLTGTRKFALNDAQRKALADFVAGGGLLVVDACGGITGFDVAAQAELVKIFPKEASQLASPIKGDNVLFTSEVAGKLEPKYRVFATEKLRAEATKFRLRGIETNGKLGVIYSPDDLSVGLVGMQVDGILGLQPDTATTLMRRVLLMKRDGKI